MVGILEGKVILLYLNNKFILMKYLIVALLVLFMSCEAPYKVVTTYVKDSTGHTTKYIYKYYEDNYYYQPPVGLMTTPLWYTPYYDYRWNNQQYRSYVRPPRIMPQPQPRPQQPQPHHNRH